MVGHGMDNPQVNFPVPIPVPMNTIPLQVRVWCPPWFFVGYPRDSWVYSKPTVSTMGFLIHNLQYKYVLYIIVIHLFIYEKGTPPACFWGNRGGWWLLVDKMNPSLMFKAMGVVVAVRGWDEPPPHIWGKGGGVVAVGGQDEPPAHVWDDGGWWWLLEDKMNPPLAFEAMGGWW